MKAVGDLARELHRRGPPMAPIISGTRSCTGRAAVRDARVAEEVSLEVDRALVEQACESRHELHAAAPSAGVPRHSIPYWSSMARFPIPRTTSARPSTQLVESGGELSHVRRIAHVERGDARTEANCLGPARHSREDQARRPCGRSHRRCSRRRSQARPRPVLPQPALPRVARVSAAGSPSCATEPNPATPGASARASSGGNTARASAPRS